MNDLVIDVEIARPRNEVIAWWTGFPDEYVAKDPREQPHRIKVEKRVGKTAELSTWWRTPFGELMVPETFTVLDDGNWDVVVHLDVYGVRQRDRFRSVEENGKTRLRIEIDIERSSTRGLVLAPVYRAYARRQYPGSFRGAAKLCERDAPRLAQS